jgi:hypothetical protein
MHRVELQECHDIAIALPVRHVALGGSVTIRNRMCGTV